MSEVPPLVPARRPPGRTPRAAWIIVVIVVGALGCGSCACAGAPAQTRTYYIVAGEVAWNYAAAGTNTITGQPFDATANEYVQASPDRIGST